MVKRIDFVIFCFYFAYVLTHFARTAEIILKCFLAGCLLSVLTDIVADVSLQGFNVCVYSFAFGLRRRGASIQVFLLLVRFQSKSLLSGLCSM